MSKNVLIVHYNTPELMGAAIRSVWKCSPDCNVVVFDNSDRRPYGGACNKYIDNTHGQLIDFNALLAQYPNKIDTTCNDWGSVKHTKTIDFCWQYFPDGFVLMDSDVLVKRDISPFFDSSVAWAGEPFVDPYHYLKVIPRLLPYLCWINVAMCQRAAIGYFDGMRSWKLHEDNPLTWYDTGASFYEDCEEARLPHKELKLDDYVIHYGGGSYMWRKLLTPYQWLEQHKDLYL